MGIRDLLRALKGYMLPSQKLNQTAEQERWFDEEKEKQMREVTDRLDRIRQDLMTIDHRRRPERSQ